MDTINNRIKKAREAAGFKSARSAALRFNWNPSTYASHENGQTPNVKEPDLRAYATAFRTSVAWLMSGEGAKPKKQKNVFYAVGYVGAGAEVIPFDDHERGAGLDEFDMPPENAVLVIVRGDSMYPRYFDNEMLFYVRDGRSPADYIGRECVVKLSDGRTYVKVLRRGQRGLFNLESWNAPLIENVDVEWAALVVARLNRS